MKKPNNKHRILEAACTLFNEQGVVSITTNHIAKDLKISPGNLYFHYSNKEEIIRELFKMMCAEIYLIWALPKKGDTHLNPDQMVDFSFDVFWKYRFFHREMYHMRRQDPGLGDLWKLHLNKTMRLWKTHYRLWVNEGISKPITDQSEIQFLAEVVLITASTFLQFYESRERPAHRNSLRRGQDHVMRIMGRYLR